MSGPPETGTSYRPGAVRARNLTHAGNCQMPETATNREPTGLTFTGSSEESRDQESQASRGRAQEPHATRSREIIDSESSDWLGAPKDKELPEAVTIEGFRVIAVYIVENVT
ncbi:hypothetical protein J6590_043444 [Homalodisca vitripennis]|nr:hypothetical protein J6590_043444 [Homalodisca vitripennis]